MHVGPALQLEMICPPEHLSVTNNAWESIISPKLVTFQLWAKRQQHNASGGGSCRYSQNWAVPPL